MLISSSSSGSGSVRSKGNDRRGTCMEVFLGLKDADDLAGVINWVDKEGGDAVMGILGELDGG